MIITVNNCFLYFNVVKASFYYTKLITEDVVIFGLLPNIQNLNIHILWYGNINFGLDLFEFN